MTETCRPEIDLVLFRNGEDLAEGGWGEEGHLVRFRSLSHVNVMLALSEGEGAGEGESGSESGRVIEMEWGNGTYDEVLQQCVSPLEVDVRPGGEMCRLLEKDGIGSVDFTHVYRHFLHPHPIFFSLLSSLRHSESERQRTSFWAEKMEFMTGM